MYRPQRNTKLLFFSFCPPPSPPSVLVCASFASPALLLSMMHSHIVGTSGLTPVSNIFLAHKKCICWDTLQSNMESQYCYCRKDCREWTISSRLKYLHVPGLSTFLENMKTPSIVIMMNKYGGWGIKCSDAGISQIKWADAGRFFGCARVTQNNKSI